MRCIIVLVSWILTSCTVTIKPIPNTQHKKPFVIHRHIGSKISTKVSKPTSSTSPTPSVSPIPPDPRILDIIKQIDKEKNER